MKGEQIVKEKVMSDLSAVLSALDNIYVKGRSNLANLSGCIAVIESVMSDLSHADIIVHEENDKA